MFSDVFNKHVAKSGMSYKAISDITGLSDTTLYRYRDGLAAPEYDSIIALSKAFACTPNDLFEEYANRDLMIHNGPEKDILLSVMSLSDEDKLKMTGYVRAYAEVLKGTAK